VQLELDELELNIVDVIVNTLEGLQLESGSQLDGVTVEMLILEMQELGVMVTGVQLGHVVGVTVEVIVLEEYELRVIVVGVQITLEEQVPIDGQVVGMIVVGEHEEEQLLVIVDMLVEILVL
jgi:hypothetical protein